MSYNNIYYSKFIKIQNIIILFKEKTKLYSQQAQFKFKNTYCSSAAKAEDPSIDTFLITHCP